MAGDDRPGSIGYFCGTLDARWPPGSSGGGVRGAAPGRSPRQRPRSRRAQARAPSARRVRGGAFRWELLCGRDGHSGRSAIDTQLVLANIDPSDRYVQCSPGSDAYRLRADESGYDNLFLAGDWTDNGLNAGCIEAATLSGPAGRERPAREIAELPDRGHWLS